MAKLNWKHRNDLERTIEGDRIGPIFGKDSGLVSKRRIRNAIRYGARKFDQMVADKDKWLKRK